LNQVELWFTKIERDIIARGISTSIADLRRRIMNYIRRHSRQRFWSCADPTRRIV